MICPKCQFEQSELNRECVRCGLIFEKYRRTPRSRLNLQAPEAADPESSNRGWPLFRDLFLGVELDTNPFYFWGRILIFLVLFVWGWKFILSPMESNYVGRSFWHLVSLPFHEAGHIFFRPLGRFMTSLGGSLGQLLMPCICLVVFILKTRDTFAGSVCLWWLGENFIDIAPYINDARARQLMLLGGNTGRTAPYGFHDWEFILNETGLLRYDHTLAQIADKIGATLLLISFMWAGYLLLKQYRNLNLSS